MTLLFSSVVQQQKEMAEKDKGGCLTDLSSWHFNSSCKQELCMLITSLQWQVLAENEELCHLYLVLHQINGIVVFHSADVTSVMTVCSLYKEALHRDSSAHVSRPQFVLMLKILQTKHTSSFWIHIFFLVLSKFLTLMTNMRKFASHLSSRTKVKHFHIQIARHWFHFHWEN